MIDNQIKTATRSNDAYAWTHHVNVDRPYVVDGLNRVASACATSFGYDGTDLIAELDGSNIVQHRYVHGPGTDNPIIWFNGNLINNTTRRFLMTDERGSIISVADSSGSTIHINSYDEYGIPAPGNTGRLGYTGQTWLSEIGMWYFKSRIYSPTLGRFLQTDPIGYEDGLNWYNYVGGDPINNIDPLGMDIVVTGNKPQNPIGGAWFPMPTVPAYSVADRLKDMNPGTGQGIGCSASELTTDPAAWTPDGDTKGDNPSSQGGRWNTDLPGGYAAAMAVFQGLSRLDAGASGDGGFRGNLDPRRPTTTLISNTGNIDIQYWKHWFALGFEGRKYSVESRYCGRSFFLKESGDHPF